MRRRWWLPAAIVGLVAVAAIVAALLVHAASSGDGARTAQLRDYLRQSHQYGSGGYELLGTVTVHGGDVTVAAQPWADPTAGAETYCGWVSDWVYGLGHGTADSRVVVTVPRRGGTGQFVLTRRGVSESCSEAALNSPDYGS